MYYFLRNFPYCDHKNRKDYRMNLPCNFKFSEPSYLFASINDNVCLYNIGSLFPMF